MSMSTDMENISLWDAVRGSEVLEELLKDAGVPADVSVLSDPVIAPFRFRARLALRDFEDATLREAN